MVLCTTAKRGCFICSDVLLLRRQVLLIHSSVIVSLKFLHNEIAFHSGISHCISLEGIWTRSVISYTYNSLQYRQLYNKFNTLLKYE